MRTVPEEALEIWQAGMEENFAAMFDVWRYRISRIDNADAGAEECPHKKIIYFRLYKLENDSGFETRSGVRVIHLHSNLTTWREV